MPAPAPPPKKSRVVATTIGGATLRLIETTGGGRARFRVEVDGASRRIRSRITYRDGWTNEEETQGWIGGDEAELGKLVECLAQPDTKRAESDGRLMLDLDRDHGSTNFNAERTQVSVDVAAPGAVVVDIHCMLRTGSFY